MNSTTALAQRLSQETHRQRSLECALRECQKSIQELEEMQQIESRMEKDAQRLAALNEPPHVRAAREAQLRQKEKEEALKRAEERRKEESERPPYWPLPRPNMSQEEKSDWWEAHFF